MLPLYALNRAQVSGAAAPVVVPDGLALTGWWRDFSVVPWAGTASAGVSGDGSHRLTTDSSNPTVGTALNGHGTALFTAASSQRLLADGTLTNYVASKSCSGWCLVNPALNSQGAMFYDLNGSVGLTFSGGNARITVNATANNAVIAISTGVYGLLTWRYDGTNLQIGLNTPPGASGGTSSIAQSTAQNVTFATRVGDNLAGSGAYLFAFIAEMGITNTVMTDANFTALKAYVNTRYALAL